MAGQQSAATRSNTDRAATRCCRLLIALTSHRVVKMVQANEHAVETLQELESTRVDFTQTSVDVAGVLDVEIQSTGARGKGNLLSPVRVPFLAARFPGGNTPRSFFLACVG